MFSWSKSKMVTVGGPEDADAEGGHQTSAVAGTITGLRENPRNAAFTRSGRAVDGDD